MYSGELFLWRSVIHVAIDDLRSAYKDVDLIKRRGVTSREMNKELKRLERPSVKNRNKGLDLLNKEQLKELAIENIERKHRVVELDLKHQRAYFSKSDIDFVMVCDYADVDHDYLLNRLEEEKLL